MKPIVKGLTAAILLLGGATAVTAQERSVRLEGRVQWIAGQTATVSLDTGAAVSVDLSRVPQDEYAGLRARDRVVVTGVISDDDNRVIGTSVMRVKPAIVKPARQPEPAGTR